MQTSSDEENQKFQIDNFELKKKGKSSAEIKRHTLDMTIENKPVEKALYLLTKGDEVQRLSVVENLPQLMNIESYSAFNKIILKIQQDLTKASAQFSISTSRVFQELIENHFRANINISSIVLRSLDSNDPVVANAWLATLLEVILILPISIIQTEILPIALQKGHTSQVTSTRIASCKILGKIVLHPNMKALEIKKFILPAVYTLCQDAHYSVRESICEQMPSIAKGLGATLVKNFLLTNLVELASDDNINVRAIAVSSVVQVLTYLDQETKTTTMVPLIMNLFITQPKLEDTSALVLAKNMGLLVTSLDDSLTPQQTENLITFYKSLTERGLDAQDLQVYNVDACQDMKGREHCANNFPAVMQFVMTKSPENINKLYENFKVLTLDSCSIVRRAIGGIFHEVAKILGVRNSMMKTEFVHLLRDDSEEVLTMLVPHISEILLCFVNVGTLSLVCTDDISSEISRALLRCFSRLMRGYNWRLSSMFLKQLEALPMVLKSDQIHNEFTPAIVKSAVHGRARPIRSQAVRTLLYFLRYNPRLAQRTWLRDHLIHELAENKSCYSRVVFFDLCKHAMELFSNKFFKQNFYTPLLKFASDRVSNLRYSFVQFLPKLREMIHLPQDRVLLTSFDQAVMAIEKSEKDRDVLDSFVLKTKEMIAMANKHFDDETERKLVEEEETIAKGKVITSYCISDPSSGDKNTKIQGQRHSRSRSMTRKSSRPDSADLDQLVRPRSLSAPRSSIITRPRR